MTHSKQIHLHEERVKIPPISCKVFLKFCRENSCLDARGPGIRHNFELVSAIQLV